MTYGLTKSITFDGSSNYASRVLTNTGLPTGNGKRTYETWVKFAALPASGSDWELLDQGAVGTDLEMILGIKNSSGTYVGHMDYYGAADSGTVSLGFSTGVWYHYAMVYNQTDIKWYVNGTLVDTVTPTRTPNTSTSILGAGARAVNAGSGKLNGQMSLARIWATDLSAATISANMCSVLGSTTNLAAEWTFDNVYTDNSGNGNTLAAVGTPTFSSDVPTTCTATTGHSLALLGVGI